MRRDAVQAAFVAAVLAATFAHLAAQPPAGQGQGQGRGDGRGATPPAPAPAEPVLSPGPSAARFPRDAAEFDQMFQKVKNWGRWGADDQLGAANLITEAKRRQAAELVKQGVSVSLAHNPITETAADNPQPFEHTMNRGFTTDTYRVSYHGYAHSHIDALCHILYQKQTYNGYSTADINTEKGCTKLGIDRLKNGIVTRGILIDIPRLRNVNYLEPGTPVFVEDLEAWEKKARIKVSPGRRDLPAHRPLGAPRGARPVGGGEKCSRLPRVDRAVAEGTRRRRSSAATLRRTSCRRSSKASACRSTRWRSPRSASTSSTTRISRRSATSPRS